MGSTKKELIEDLQDVLYTTDLTQKKADAINRIIANAKKGMYHDFESDLATPKMQLYAELIAAGCATIAGKVEAGAYDEDDTSSPEEKERLTRILRRIKR